jgi:hypothetical protein
VATGKDAVAVDCGGRRRIRRKKKKKKKKKEKEKKEKKEKKKEKKKEINEKEKKGKTTLDHTVDTISIRVVVPGKTTGSK